ncbi:SubName: Full=Uncharacterized protein {ECO:0000313/EMBL:CCA73209.1} [Serendipita indica DSM 11827]|nr:SubName: Full=Uncharacterized protein {ECO:0000313/EMBL:CCA73209.1} [Serendipita indica DSM 11827]
MPWSPAEESSGGGGGQKGARQRTDSRQSSLAHVNTGSVDGFGVYNEQHPLSPTEDGFITTSDVSQGSGLSRSTNRRVNRRPLRNFTTGSATSSEPHPPSISRTDEASMVNTPARSNSDFVPYFENSTGEIYTSPTHSTTSFQTGNNHSYASMVPHKGREQNSLSPPSSLAHPIASNSAIRAPPRKSSMPLEPPSGQGSTPPVPTGPHLISSKYDYSAHTDAPQKTKEVPRPSQSESNVYASVPPPPPLPVTETTIPQSSSRRRWATIRSAVRQTPEASPAPSEVPLPPTIQVETHSHSNTSHGTTLKVTPAASSISTTSLHNAAAGFSIPRTGSALSHLSENNLAPPTRHGTSTSHASPAMSSLSLSSGHIGPDSTHTGAMYASRSAKAVANFRNAVDQAMSGARSNVAVMGTSFGNLAVFGGTSNATRKDPTASAVIVNAIKAENESQFARDVYGICMAARLGQGHRAHATDTVKSIDILQNPAAIGFAPVMGLGSTNVGAFKRVGRKAASEGVSGVSESEGTQASSATSFEALRSLHHLIANTISSKSQTNTSHIPHHSLVLSTLLQPFVLSSQPKAATRGKTDDEFRSLIESERRKAEENDRWIALETFELVVRRWKPYGPMDQVGRWMWCCYAAKGEGSIRIGAKMRERILLTLEQLLQEQPTVTMSPKPQTRELGGLGLGIGLNAMQAGAAPDNIRRTYSTRSPSRNPRVLQSLLQALYSILPSSGLRGDIDRDRSILDRIIENLESNRAGYIPLEAEDLEGEYAVQGFTGPDNEIARGCLVVEALTKLIETGEEDAKFWLIGNLLENVWIRNFFAGRSSTSSLRIAARCRKISGILRMSLHLIRETCTDEGAQQNSLHFQNSCSTIFSLLREHVLPEIVELAQDIGYVHHTMPEGSQNEGDAKKHDFQAISRLLYAQSVTLTLEMLRIPAEAYRAQLLVEKWLADAQGWKPHVEAALRDIIVTADWKVVVQNVNNMRKAWPGSSTAFPASIVIPLIFERISSSPASPPSLVKALLADLSHHYPRIFFAPLFQCARSNNVSTVSTHLRTLVSIGRIFPALWTTDAEMMCIALMNEPGIAGSSAVSSAKGKGRDGDPPKWGTARLGQCVLFLEMIYFVRDLRLQREVSDSTSTPSDVVSYLLALEARVAVLLDAKEAAILRPFSMRLLIVSLLFEIRLYTRSLKPAVWLPKVIAWGCSAHVGAMIFALVTAEEGEAPSTLRGWTPVTEETFSEVEETLGGIRAIYTACWLELPVTPKNPHGIGKDDRNPSVPGKSTELERSLTLLASLDRPALAIFKLLVAVSGILHSEHFVELGPILWSQHLDGADPSALGSVAYLIMQSAEKGRKSSVARAIYQDLNSDSESVQAKAIDRIARLFSWRYQILTQTILTDRSHRRPFKGARQPLSFVPTDIGSIHFIPDRSHTVDRVQFASTLPSDIRRRLIELGWDKDETSIDRNPAKDMAPLSVAPSDRLTVQGGPAPLIEVNDSTTKGLLRRKSSGGGQGGNKKKPVFVPELAALLAVVLKLSTSSNLELSNSARNLLLEVLRDDPGIFARPHLEHLLDDPRAILQLDESMHLQARMPAALSHLIFNHFAGVLKHLARVQSLENPLVLYAYSMPSIAHTAAHVSGISIRELKRAKLDQIMLPSGSLWFTDSMLPGPMFPRGLAGPATPFELLPPSLVAITMVRTAQNMMLTNLLKRDSKEVHTIRKMFTNFTLPALTKEVGFAEKQQISRFLPLDASALSLKPLTNDEVNVRLISLALARSHLVLVAQIFRCLSPQTNDVQEVFQLLDTVNQILIAHGGDTGIVSHAMIAYMLAMARFRRLFSSNGGFVLIMPAVWKTYCDSEGGSKAIRGAIEYAANRFNAIHTDTFIFQAVDAAASMVAHPSLLAPESFARNVATLISSLGASFRGEINAGGIQNATRSDERDAMLTRLNEPEVLISAAEGQGNMSAMVDEFGGRVFSQENVARLLLTVIADDPTIVRAENFLKLFRFITPSLYDNSMQARTVIREGIDALGRTVFARSWTPRTEVRAAQGESGANVPDMRSTQPTAEFSSARLLAKATAPSSLHSMRQDYLQLIVAYTKAGGQLPTDVARRAVEMVKSILRESPSSITNNVAMFLREFADSSLLKPGKAVTSQEAIALLGEIPVLVHQYGLAVDFSGIFEVLTRMCSEDRFIADHGFNRMVVSGFFRAGFNSVESASLTNTLRGIGYRRSLVTLTAVLALLPGIDVLSHLQSRRANAGILAGFIIPLCLHLPSSAPTHATAASLRRTWLHLIGYAFNACLNVAHGRAAPKTTGTGLQARPSWGDGQHSSPRGIVASLLFALQAIKIILIRVGEEISKALPDIWLRASNLIRESLKDSNGNFFLSSDLANDMSPIPSPSSSRPPSPSQQADYQGSAVGPNRERTPRAVDYAAWSILELICFYRMPLSIHLRLWLQERLSLLEARLDAAGVSTRVSSFMRDPRRQSFSPYSKARRRSGVPSNTPSPDASPSLGAVRVGSPHHIFFLGPEFQIREAKGASTPVDPLRAAAKLISMTRPKLVQDSHRRVSVVRIFWGYEAFTGDDMSGFEAWTMASALKKITAETKELTREFHDVAKLEGDD